VRYTQLLKKENGLIDWDQDAAAIDRRVRAFTPRPSAFTFFKGQRLIVLKGAPASDRIKAGAPGQVRRVTKRGLEIQAGDATLFWIELVRPESRGPLDAYAFSLNGRVRAGDILG